MVRIGALEDDDELLLLLADLFADHGWDMVPYTDADTAVEFVKRERPDVILLDLWLGTPEKGWNLLQALQDEPATRSIPLIVWSGATHALRDREAWLAERGIRVLDKPFEVNDLYEAIEAALVHPIQ